MVASVRKEPQMEYIAVYANERIVGYTTSAPEVMVMMHFNAILPGAVVDTVTGRAVINHSTRSPLAKQRGTSVLTVCRVCTRGHCLKERSCYL